MVPHSTYYEQQGDLDHGNHSGSYGGGEYDENRNHGLASPTKLYHTSSPPFASEDDYLSDTQPYGINNNSKKGYPFSPEKQPQSPRRSFSASEYMDGYTANPNLMTSLDPKKRPKTRVSSGGSVAAPGIKSKTRRHSLHYGQKRSSKERDRERVLSSAPINELVQRVIAQEDKAKDARRRLEDAMTRLQITERRAVKAEQAQKDLELAQARQGLQVAQGVMGVKDELSKARQDAGVYKAQLQFMELEMNRARESAKTVQDQRDEAERAAAQARAAARKINDEKIILLARDEGRKQGFAEGIARAKEEVFTEMGMVRQRGLMNRVHQTPIGSGGAFIEEYVEEEEEAPDRRRGRRSAAPTPRSQQTRTMAATPQVDPNVLRQEAEAAEAARREAQRLEVQLLTERAEAERERERARERQVEFDRDQESLRRREREREEALRKESDALRDELRKERDKREEKERELRQKLEEEVRELRRQHEQTLEEERARQAERQRDYERALTAERERLRERERLAQQEREREAQQQREREAQQQREREAQQQREREAQQQREREAQQQREREAQRQREQEQRDRERETGSNASSKRSAGTASGRLPYMAMPPPPSRILPQRPGQSSARPPAVQPVPVPPPVVSEIPVQPPPGSVAGPSRYRFPPGQAPMQPQQVQPNPYANGRRPLLRHQSTLSSTEMPEPIVFPNPSRHRPQSSTDTSDTLQSLQRRRGRQNDTPDTLDTQPRRRNSSPDTLDTLQSPSSGMSFDIVSFPNPVSDRRPRDQLSVIPEGSSVRSGTPSRTSEAAPSPAWLSNPPVDYSRNREVDQWRRASDAFDPPDSAGPPVVPDSAREFLTPGFQPRSRDPQRPTGPSSHRSSMLSTDFDIQVEPPSGPPSDLGAIDHEHQQRPGLLSPNSAHAPAPLPQTQPQAPTAPPEPPVIPRGIQGLPPNFVPQTFTSTPQAAPSRPLTNPPQPPSMGSGFYSNLYRSATSDQPPKFYSNPDRPSYDSSSASGPPVIPPQANIPPSSRGGFAGIYAGVPSSSSSSSTGRGGYPSAGPPVSKHQHQVYPPAPPGAMPRNSIYSNIPVVPRTGTASSSASGMQTPHQIYVPSPPGGTSRQTPVLPSHTPGGSSNIPVIPPPGVVRQTPIFPSRSENNNIPVIPPPPQTYFIPPPSSNMTPLLRPGMDIAAGATPASYSQALPAGHDDDEEDDDGEDISPETRRNTEANARLRGNTMTPTHALPIPPPSGWR